MLRRLGWLHLRVRRPPVLRARHPHPALVRRAVAQPARQPRQALWERRREKVRSSAFGACQRVGLYLRISHEDNPRFLDRPCEDLVKASGERCPMKPPYNNKLMAFRACYLMLMEGHGYDSARVRLQRLCTEGWTWKTWCEHHITRAYWSLLAVALAIGAPAPGAVEAQGVFYAEHEPGIGLTTELAGGASVGPPECKCDPQFAIDFRESHPDIDHLVLVAPSPGTPWSPCVRAMNSSPVSHWRTAAATTATRSASESPSSRAGSRAATSAPNLRVTRSRNVAIVPSLPTLLPALLVPLLGPPLDCLGQHRFLLLLVQFHVQKFCPPDPGPLSRRVLAGGGRAGRYLSLQSCRPNTCARKSPRRVSIKSLTPFSSPRTSPISERPWAISALRPT